MLRSFALAAALGLALATPAPAPALRLRGGGVLSSLSEKLGWKRDKVGPAELGCGPMPQVRTSPSWDAERVASAALCAAP